MYLIFEQGVAKGELSDAEKELLSKYLAKAREVLPNVKYIYVKTKNGEYIGVGRGEAFVFVKAVGDPLGVALLRAEEILNLLGKSEG